MPDSPSKIKNGLRDSIQAILAWQPTFFDGFDLARILFEPTGDDLFEFLQHLRAMHLGEDVVGTIAKALVEALDGEDGFLSLMYLFEAHWKIRDHQRSQHTLHLNHPQEGVLYMVWDFKDIS